MLRSQDELDINQLINISSYSFIVNKNVALYLLESSYIENSTLFMIFIANYF